MPKPFKNIIKQDYEKKVMTVRKGEPYLDPEIAQEIGLMLIKGKHPVANFEREINLNYGSQTVTVFLGNGYTLEIKKEYHDC